MTELINRWKNLIEYTSNSADRLFEESINVIFTSNTKLLTRQTASRVHAEVDNDLEQDKDLEEEQDDEDEDDDFSVETDSCEEEEGNKTFAWISGVNKKTTTINDMFAKVTADDDDNEVNNIICCTNKSRMRSVWELLRKLHKKFLKHNFNKRVNIWVDEADDCTEIWKGYKSVCEEFVETNFIQNVVLITATMVKVYKQLHAFEIEPHLRTYENTHASVYHKYTESVILHQFSENARNAVTHLRRVLDNYPGILSPGIKLFSPGNKARKSHEEICDELLSKGFNVLILNGVNKEIRFCDTARPPLAIDALLQTDLEISKTLNNLYYKLQLFNSPFAVTGNLCIGRGITFASQLDEKEFLFTHGIIPDMPHDDEAYQLVMRNGGNIKGFASYVVPTIFVSEKTDALIKKQENLAIDFAKKFFQKGVEEPMVQVTREMLKKEIGTDPVAERKEKRKERDENKQFIMGSMNEFETLVEANEFCRKIKKGSRYEKEEDFKNDVGDFVCTTTKRTKKYSYEDFISETASWSTSSLLNMKDLENGKVSKVIKPVYRDEKVVWIVRWGVDVMKADSVKKPNISKEELSTLIRLKKCKIEFVPPKNFEVELV
jgi:hypothetical protein